MRSWLLAAIGLVLIPGLAWAAVPTPTTAPTANGLSSVSVTCATTATPFNVSGTSYLTIQVPPTATQTVWFAWGIDPATGIARAATTAAPSQGYAAGTNIAWGGGTGSCIVASGSQVISVGTK